MPKKPKGKAVKIESDTKPPTKDDVDKMQRLARRISPTLLALLEAKAEKKKDGK